MMQRETEREEKRCLSLSKEKKKQEPEGRTERETGHCGDWPITAGTFGTLWQSEARPGRLVASFSHISPVCQVASVRRGVCGREQN